MNVKKVYKNAKKETSGIPIKKAMDEIDSYIDDIDLNGSFYKEYASLKNQIFVMDVIAPSAIYGVATGFAISLWESGDTIFSNIIQLLICLAITILVSYPYFHSTHRRILYPYLLKKMEDKIETQKDAPSR